MYDVVIVGAGPAESTAAKYLAEKKLKVILIDKEKFPRNKSCGGGLPLKVLKQFDYLEKNNLIESYTYGGYIYSSSLKYVIDAKKETPVLAMIRRINFDYNLVKLAIKKGAEFVDGKKVIDININPDKAIVILDDNIEIQTKIIIGSDGVWSTVAEKTGLRSSNTPANIALYCEFPMTKQQMDQYFTEKRYGHMHNKVLGINGYGWVFPKKEHVNIGIGIVGESIEKNLKKFLNKYIQLLKDNKNIPTGINVGEIKGAALPKKPLDQTYAERVILCGDAAGLINPFSGEGIDYAMYSARLAAEVVYNAIEKRDYSSKFLSKYEKLWKKDFGKDIKLFLMMVKRWRSTKEKYFKLVSQDQKLSNLLLEIACGNLGVSQNKWKFIRRIIYLRIKNTCSW